MQDLQIQIDLDEYLRALEKSMLAAEGEVFILGWDFDPIALIHHRRRNKRMADFLMEMLEQNPKLKLKFLIWSISFVTDKLKIKQLTSMMLKKYHERIELKYYNMQRWYTSFHIKAVVFADHAYLGGMDLATDRYDDHDHKVDNPKRTGLFHIQHGPFHDIQISTSNQQTVDNIKKLAEAFWHKKDLQLSPSSDDYQLVYNFNNTHLTNIKSNYLEAFQKVISEAQNYIYIENQYFCSEAITDMLVAKLQEKSGPQITIILPKKSSNWFVHLTLDKLSAKNFLTLKKADRYNRLKIYYPTSENTPIYVHSKVLITDDKYLLVGSANTAARSFQKDAELGLLITDDQKIGPIYKELYEHLQNPAKQKELKEININKYNRTYFNLIPTWFAKKFA